MAALPQKYPGLVLHLTDESLTPIISSAMDPALAGPDSSSGGDDHQDHRLLQTRAAALDMLSATALRARDMAARLGLGCDACDAAAAAAPLPPSAALLEAGLLPGMTPPEHVVVSYSTGAVLIESFLDPHQRHSRGVPPAASSSLLPNDDHDAANAPLLVSLVVAPGHRSLPEAQRAASRLERVGHALQDEMAAEERRQG